MTNAEKIRGMSTEELADFLFELIGVCEEAASCEEYKYNNLNICMSDYNMQIWLESEAEE